MATAGISGNLTTTLMQKLDGELICGICLELFNMPIMLPCGHNFCHQCIAGVINSGMSFSFISIGPPTSFNCPVCQAVVNTNKFNQSGLLVNKALENIVELYKSCAPVDIFDSAWNKDIEVPVGKCKEHGEPEDRFCDSCSVTLCSECEKTKHKSAKAKHRVDSLKHAAVSYQTEIADILTDLKKKLIPLNDRIHHLENVVRMIQDNQDSINKKLEQSMLALMAYLRQRQEGLKGKLENEMRNKELPIIEELERCRSIKVNIQELMKKLSEVRHIQDATLKLKMMKDTCKQLTTVVCFDIDTCLQNTHDTGTDIPVWELNIEGVMESVNVLDWIQGEQGAIKPKCKDAGIQTTSQEGENLQLLTVKPLFCDTGVQEKGGNWDKVRTFGKYQGVNYGLGIRENWIRGAGSPERTRLDDNLFDEIDGDYPKAGIKVQRQKENGVETKFKKERKADIGATEVKSNQEKDRAKESSYVDDKQNAFLHLDSDKDVRPTVKIKGRSSLPLESTTVTENKNSNPKASVTKAKKSYSDKDLIKTERSYSPSNAEVLAKFVARRRTLSPSKSSPSLKTLVTLSDTSKGEDLNVNLKRNTSSEAVKSLSETFVGAENKQDQVIKIESVRELLSVKNNKETNDLYKAADKYVVSSTSNLEIRKIALEEPKQSGKTNIEVDNVDHQLVKEKFELDTASSYRKVTSNQPDIANSHREVTSKQSDVASSHREVTSKQPDVASSHREVTSKQPDVASSHREVTSKQSDVASSHREVTSKQADVASSHREVNSKQSDVASSHREVTSKQPDVASSHREVTSKQSDVASSHREVTSKQSDVASSHREVTSTQKTTNMTKRDITNSKSDTDYVEEQPVSHHKSFSKQPIGVRLDFNLGLHVGETVDKSHLKRITEV